MPQLPPRQGNASKTSEMSQVCFFKPTGEEFGDDQVGSGRGVRVEGSSFPGVVSRGQTRLINTKHLHGDLYFLVSY